MFGVCYLILKAQNTKVLYNKVANQSFLHAKYGGVVPEIASRNHLSSLPLLVNDALESTKSKLSQIQAISQLSGSSVLANANSQNGCRQNALGAVLIGSFSYLAKHTYGTNFGTLVALK